MRSSGLAALAAFREDKNTQWLDRYSFSHAAMGVLFEASKIPAWAAIGSHIAFEMIEDGLKQKVSRIWPDTRADGWQNHVGDVLVFTAGYYGARALREKPGGDAGLTAFVALAAGVWTWNLIRGHSWGT